MADLPAFPGAADTGWCRWLAWARAAAVGCMNCGTYDRGVIDLIAAPPGASSPDAAVLVCQHQTPHRQDRHSLRPAGAARWSRTLKLPLHFPILIN
jgi:hypothetical protein